MSEEPLVKKIGLSKTRPVSEVQQGPLTRGRKPKGPSKAALKIVESAERGRVYKPVPDKPRSERVGNVRWPIVVEEKAQTEENTPCVDSIDPVVSSESVTSVIDNNPTMRAGIEMAQIKFVLDNGKERKTNQVVYKVEGRRGSVRFSASALGENPPAEFLAEVPDGVFAEPKRALTPEERKEARKNAPKPTLADKEAALLRKLEKLRAKQAAAQTATQPADAQADVMANA